MKKKYYYIPFDPYQELEYYEQGCLVRAGQYLYNNDYPTHKHMTCGYVKTMELIPEKRMHTVKWLSENIDKFKMIEAGKEELLKYEDHVYLLAFEKEHDTSVYWNCCK